MPYDGSGLPNVKKPPLTSISAISAIGDVGKPDLDRFGEAIQK